MPIYTISCYIMSCYIVLCYSISSYIRLRYGYNMVIMRCLMDGNGNDYHSYRHIPPIAIIYPPESINSVYYGS